MKPDLINKDIFENVYSKIIKMKINRKKTLSFNINIFLILIFTLFVLFLYNRFYEKKNRNIDNQNKLFKKHNNTQQETYIKKEGFFNEYNVH